VDEFDQAEACGEAPSRLFRSDGDAFEALEASDDLFDARVRLVRYAARHRCLAIGLAGVTSIACRGRGRAECRNDAHGEASPPVRSKTMTSLEESDFA
jgi:hypothetical protein